MKLLKKILETPSLLSAAKELNGLKLSHTHQKLISLTDHSELGWAVVGDNETDELVSNHEDTKRMREALVSLSHT